jgi:NTE family protein
VRVGVAFSGGALHGIIHIGVLRALCEAGVQPVAYTGASAGALVAGLAAFGFDDRAQERLARTLARRPLVYLTPNLSGIVGLLRRRLPEGFVTARGLEHLVRMALGERPFSAARWPVAVTATDAATGRRVVFASHRVTDLWPDATIPAWRGIRASIALPGVLTPVHLAGRVLIDGGVVDNLPVDLCRELGADYVIGVSLSGVTFLPPRPTFLDIGTGAIGILLAEVSTFRGRPDLLIEPDLAGVGAFDLDVDALVALGYRTAQRVLAGWAPPTPTAGRVPASGAGSGGRG